MQTIERLYSEAQDLLTKNTEPAEELLSLSNAILSTVQPEQQQQEQLKLIAKKQLELIKFMRQTPISQDFDAKKEALLVGYSQTLSAETPE